MHHFRGKLLQGDVARLDPGNVYIQYRTNEGDQGQGWYGYLLVASVISQVSHDWGAELRYENTAPLGTRTNRLTVGYQPAWLVMQNRQYVNNGGAHGALTRDEVDRVTTNAVYAEDALSVGGNVTGTLGGRIDRSVRSVADRFLSNGNQSDRQAFTPVTPRLGVLWTSTGGTQLFANASRTVEPPLLLELTSFGNAGGFNDLRAQAAWQYEAGARRASANRSWEVSVYDIELRDEIVNLNIAPFPGATFTVPTYRNVERSRPPRARGGNRTCSRAWTVRRRREAGPTDAACVVHLAKNEYVRDTR